MKTKLLGLLAILPLLGLSPAFACGSTTVRFCLGRCGAARLAQKTQGASGRRLTKQINGNAKGPPRGGLFICAATPVPSGAKVIEIDTGKRSPKT